MTQKLVRDLMTVGVPTCRFDTPVMEAARLLVEKNLDELVVLNNEGEGVGICGVPQLAALYGREDLPGLAAEDCMLEGVPELPADLPAALAAPVMMDRGIRTAYIMHNSAGIIYPAAYITLRHIVRALAAREERDLKDLGISAQRQSPLDAFIQRRDEARRRAGLK